MANIPSETCDRGKAGSGMALGIAIGVAIGAAVDNISLWLALGVALGAGIDAARTCKRNGTEGRG